MCGIVGYAGMREAAPVVLEGLKRLEYRGYDSWGIACVAASGNAGIIKKTGKIGEVSEGEVSALRGSVGLSQTRWATHGGVTDANAHPHACCNGEIFVVHNGIIENYAELRDELTELRALLGEEEDAPPV